MKKIMSRASLMAAVGLLLGGCAPKMVLAGHDYVGQKSVLYVLQQAPMAGNDQAYDLLLRVCSHDDGGQLSECKNSTVLKNVYAQPIY